MAVIESLEVDIQSKSDSVNESLDDLVRRLGLVAEGISAIGKNMGLDNFAKKAAEATKGLSSIQNATKDISSSMAPQMQKVSKSLEQITAQYANLGKGFIFKGSSADIQKQIDKYTNSLELAKLKKEELETAGKTEGKAYEAAVAKVIEYGNVIENLKQQLSEMQAAQPQLKINISGIEETRQTIETVGESIRESVSLPESAFNYNAEAMAEVFGESAKDVENWGQVIERVGNNAVIKLHELSQPFELQISGIEETEQQLERFSGDLQNMKNLFMQTFSDLKSGDLWRYLSASVKDYTKAVQMARGMKIYTEDYKLVLSDIERTESALEKLEQKQRDLQAAGTSGESKEWRKLAAEISAAESQLDSYINKRNEMESSGADVQFSCGLANQSWIKTMGAVAGEAMSSLLQKIAAIPGAVLQAIGNIPIIGRVAKEAAFLGQKAFEGLKFAMSSIASIGGKVVGAVSAIADGIKKFSSGIKSVISKISSMTKSLTGVKSASGGMNTSFSGGLKTMLKYGLGIRSLYVLFNKLRNAIKEGMKNIVQYSAETNASVSLLKNSLTQLKNASAAMVAPLLNAFAPALNQIIQLCVKAANSINQLISSLMGKGTWIKAKTLTDSYVDSISKAGKAAKVAIRPFDELKVISMPDSGGTETSPEDMFETVDVEENFKNLSERLKAMWESTDFTELGAGIGERLKNTLESIDWNPIKELVQKVGKSVATLINGFVEIDGLAASIGSSIGEFLNVGVSGINSFLDNMHWDSVGAFIGEVLNGIVDTIDWEGLGHLFAAKWNALFETIGNAVATFDWSQLGVNLSNALVAFINDLDTSFIGMSISETIKGLLDMVVTFIENTDWKELGNTIATKAGDFLGSIDWSGIVSRVFEGIGAALGGLALFLWGLIENAWNSVVNWWNEVAFEDGKFVPEGLLKGIWEGLKNIDKWLKENVFDPFINGFKKVFGIASPSKVMAEQGGFIISGLLQGLTDNIGSMWEWVKKIPDKLTGFFKDLPSNFLDIGGNIISGLWNGIKNTWDNVSNGIKDIGSGIVSTFKNVFDIHSPSRVMFELGDYTMQGFQNGLENLYQPILSSVKTFGRDLQFAPAPSLSEIYSTYDYRVSSPQYGNTGYADGFMGAGRGMVELLAETRNQNQLLQRQNGLLEAILQKPNMSSSEALDLLRPAYRSEAIRRFGNSAAFDPVLG